MSPDRLRLPGRGGRRHDGRGRAAPRRGRARRSPEDELQRMHVTMQTLGRIAIIGGSARWWPGSAGGWPRRCPMP
ncbi:MAG: hypothetical protein M0C28_46930 [Candidatus Moduliflexus flocculans]|nr:hypothetical protein [Candidatus Moduliflexus flocculans]